MRCGFLDADHTIDFCYRLFSQQGKLACFETSIMLLLAHRCSRWQTVPSPFRPVCMMTRTGALKLVRSTLPGVSSALASESVSVQGIAWCNDRPRAHGGYRYSFWTEPANDCGSPIWLRVREEYKRMCRSSRRRKNRSLLFRRGVRQQVRSELAGTEADQAGFMNHRRAASCRVRSS